jgi:mannitol/fructose-specific phosphotransferase system IIA component (Ntr-type)
MGKKTMTKIIARITKSFLDLTSRPALSASPNTEDLFTHIEKPEEINLARKKAYNK